VNTQVPQAIFAHAGAPKNLDRVGKAAVRSNDDCNVVAGRVARASPELTIFDCFNAKAPWRCDGAGDRHRRMR